MFRAHAPRAGYSRADLHIHTSYSDGVASPEDVLNYYALHSGCSVIAITDHDTLDGALRAQRHARDHADVYGHLQVIVGEEISTSEGHVIGLFLEEWIPPGMDAHSTVEAIHGQGGLAIAAHPYTSWMRWAGLVGVGDLIKKVPFDAVETRNANFTEFFANRKAECNAGSLARLGNSDGHFLGAVGRCFTDFPGSTGDDLRQAIYQRSTIPGGGCYGPFTIAKFIFQQLRARGSIWPRRREFKRQSAVGGLEIRVERSPSLATIVPMGRIDALSMPELKETLRLLARTKQSLVLDLSRVVAVDTVGVTAIVAGMKHARANGVGFCLAAVPPVCARALNGAGLERAFPRAATTRQAREQVIRQSSVAAQPARSAVKPAKELVGEAR